jgi:hypothetical protein
MATFATLQVCATETYPAGLGVGVVAGVVVDGVVAHF